MKRDRIKPDENSPEFQAVSTRELRSVEGGRCWDGPLGDRDECPPKPAGTILLTEIISGFDTRN
jgi:hypothetical protein